MPRAYANLQNSDSNGRLRLNCKGTLEDLARQGITLREGMSLTLYADDLDEQGQPDELQAEGIVLFSEPEHCWVAEIDRSNIRHASQKQSEINGRAPFDAEKLFSPDDTKPV